MLLPFLNILKIGKPETSTRLLLTVFLRLIKEEIQNLKINLTIFSDSYNVQCSNDRICLMT